MPRPYGGRVGRVDMRWATRVGHGRRVDTRGAVTLELYGDETGRSGVGAVGTAGAGASGGGFAVRSHGGLFAVRTGLRSPGERCGGASRPVRGHRAENRVSLAASAHLRDAGLLGRRPAHGGRSEERRVSERG